MKKSNETNDTHDSLGEWSLAEVARMVFPPGVQERVLVVLRAYFDESGTQGGSRALAIGGFLASAEQWEAFDEEWRAALGRFGFSFFHMTDYESRQPPFDGLSNPERHVLITSLIAVIKRHTIIPVSSALPSQDAEYLEAQARPDDPSASPYVFCAQECLKKVGLWAEENNHQELVAYFFEQGAGYDGQMDQLRKIIVSSGERIRRLRFGSLTFADKKRFSPLQAADIMAYETYKEMDNGIVRRPGEGRKRDVRKSIRALLVGTEHEKYCRYADKRSFPDNPNSK